jgi:L-asparaginase II
MTAESLIEVWRGDFVESRHLGHVAIWHADTGLVGAFGDVAAPVLPRSACKMIQALPLLESGAAARAGLTDDHLALACASHQGADIHTTLADRWLRQIGLSETDLRCGVQWPSDEPARDSLIRAFGGPDQRHNNCSGKHCGFLTLAQHLKAGPEYIDPDHPVQRMVRETFEAVTEDPIAGFAIDGCSAPNFATSLSGFARALSRFAAAAADGGGGTRAEAMARLYRAMTARPDLVAGAGRACTRLMRAMGGRAAIKTGAEGVFAAIVPERRIGVAVKIDDGAGRGAEAAIAQTLIALGVLAPADPAAQAYRHGPIVNWRGVETGFLKPVGAFAAWRP